MITSPPPNMPTAERLLLAADTVEQLAGDGRVSAESLRREAADVLFADRAEEVARNTWADECPTFPWEQLGDTTRRAMIAAVYNGRRLTEEVTA